MFKIASLYCNTHKEILFRERELMKQVGKSGDSKYKLVFCSPFGMWSKFPPAGNVVAVKGGGWGAWNQSCTLCA